MPVLLFSGILSAIITAANPHARFADIWTQANVPRFVSTEPVYDLPDFDSYHVEEQHKRAFGEGEIE